MAGDAALPFKGGRVFWTAAHGGDLDLFSVYIFANVNDSAVICIPKMSHPHE